jgi:ribonuclease-3
MKFLGKYLNKKAAKAPILSPEIIEFQFKLSKILNFKPDNMLLYQAAFTHRSKNLGDAMLNLIIAEHLYLQVPHADEGYLTKMRSKIVSREHLNELGKDLDLLPFVKSNIHANQTGDNIYGNVFEALVGAIYLDKGYEKCHLFLHEKLILPYVDINRLEGKVTSYKSLIIEWCQKEKKRFLFENIDEETSESQKHFSTKLSINGQIIAKGRATSKKKSEELAAKRAFYAFQDLIVRK